MSAVSDSAEPDPQVDSASIDDAHRSAPVDPQLEGATTESSRAVAWTCALGAALVAGLLTWGIGERMHNYYTPSEETQRNRYALAALDREQRAADQKNAAIAFGAFGAMLGLLMGVAGGALRRSAPAAFGAAVSGLVLGGGGAALVSYALTPVFAQFYSDESPSLLLPFLVRGGIWGMAGMAAGLALGWGWHGPRGIPGALIGGLVGSLFATILFEVVNGMIFPSDRNDAVIPSSIGTRLLAYLGIAVGVAIGAVLVGSARARPASPARLATKPD